MESTDASEIQDQTVKLLKINVIVPFRLTNGLILRRSMINYSHEENVVTVSVTFKMKMQQITKKIAE